MLNWVVVIAWIGALKFTSYEAHGIQPLITNSPLMSWFYNIVDVRTFAGLLGVFEIAVALLIAINLLTTGHHFDVATRDVALAVCAFALGRLTEAAAPSESGRAAA